MAGWTKCEATGKTGKPCGTFAHESWGACWHHLLADPVKIAALIERLQARQDELTTE